MGQKTTQSATSGHYGMIRGDIKSFSKSPIFTQPESFICTAYWNGGLTLEMGRRMRLKSNFLFFSYERMVSGLKSCIASILNVCLFHSLVPFAKKHSDMKRANYLCHCVALYFMYAERKAFLFIFQIQETFQGFTAYGKC